MSKNLSISPEEFLVTCTAMAEGGQHAEAEVLVRELIARLPDHPLADYALGIVLGHAGKRRDAIIAYRTALLKNPNLHDARWNLALMLLRLGELREGYHHFEARWHTEAQKHEAREYEKPMWSGNLLVAGKSIHVWVEQGHGDFIMMARYLPRLADIFETVYVEAYAPMANLIADSMPENVKIMEPFSEPLEYDYHLPIMSLPMVMGTDPDTIPSEFPYLKVADDYREKWRDILGEKKRPRIGLAWSGAAKHPNDANRSIPLASLLDILNLPADVHFLQNEVRDYDTHELRLGHAHLEEIQDFADTAALIEQMDVVVSVDTSVAHLAGALGKPLILLVPIRPDYRWMLDMPTSPWYKTAHLFRQAPDGFWGDAIDQASVLAYKIITQSEK